jgi:hypothetical protein
VSLHPADERMLDAAMAQPYGARFLSKIETCGPIVRPELGPCWTWQASLVPGGYGQFALGRRIVRTHRLACELAHGKPSADAPCAIHACDLRHCVRPSHLRWGTWRENSADMVSRGRCPRAKLDAGDVLAILADLDRGASLRSISRRFGIGRAAVGHINTGQNWSWLTGRSPANDTHAEAV